MTNYSDKQIIFLKNKTVPIDKYELAAQIHNFDQIRFIPLIKHVNRPAEVLQLLNDSNYLNNLKYIIVTSKNCGMSLFKSFTKFKQISERNIV